MGTIWCDVPFSAVGGRRHELLGDAGLRCSDAPVGDASVVSGGREALAEAFVVVRQRADLTAQGHVGGGDAYDVGICPALLQLDDLAQEFGDALALVGDLGVGGLEGIFGVQRALTPGSLDHLVLGFLGIGPEGPFQLVSLRWQ
ncbi:hypothetical protein GCM10023086_58370 [Streptomyces venetus]|uniref:Uncharacterized protein n=1 Tax=Streptomyces venetus TaxID=1701086 RepID=A0ABP8GSF7_9ACTN